MNVRKFIRQVISLVAQFPFFVQSVRKCIRSGGYTTVNVSQQDLGEALAGRRILITGGGSGIGLSIAERCLEEGAQVVITGRDLSKLKSVKEDLNNDNLNILKWDVTDIHQVKEKLEQVRQLLGGDIDVLVNNAGVLSRTFFPAVQSDDWDFVYAVNSKGAYFLTQAVCDHWLRVNSDRTRKVLNISSQGGYVGATHPYRMTKWDIAGLTQGLGVMLAPHGILVNGIAPGIIATDMQKEFLKEKNNLFSIENPLQRIALPEEIAELAVFMLSDRANFFVGQTIVCDGGYSIK